MSCNHVNPATYMFCGECGSELIPQACFCGFEYRENDTYCGKCGTRRGTQAVKNAQPTPLEGLYDLDELITSTNEEQTDGFAQMTRLSQADIEDLFPQ